LKTLAPSEAARPFAADEHLVQIGLLDETRLAVSHARPADLQDRRRRLWPHPGGVVRVPRDPRPPSRAYAKLTEALALFGANVLPNQTVVDLGASPGGWSYVALAAGAKVVAVDRAPLRADLMNSPRLTFVRGDAFAFTPDAPVAWMIADVAAFPERIVELLDVWLREQRCRRAIVTMKFTRDRYREPLAELKRQMPDITADWTVRRLLHNKNEATVFATSRKA
jgi:23S rRNA (cytidine2498-2'-O)-methyltransferase